MAIRTICQVSFGGASSFDSTVSTGAVQNYVVNIIGFAVNESLPYDSGLGTSPVSISLNLLKVAANLDRQKIDRFIRNAISGEILSTLGWTIDPDDIYMLNP